jgi:SAM-dependent methyltransferase
LVADVGILYSARTVLDIGSGFSAPAVYWKSLINSLNVVCVDVNLRQLKFGFFLQDSLKENKITYRLPKDITREIKSSLKLELPHLEKTEKLSFINATSTVLPFADNSVDRIIALESAQHFRPLGEFLMESNRVLEKNGIFVAAMPVVQNPECLNRNNNIFSEMMSLISSFFELGVLSFTWMSEHYELNYIKSQIVDARFQLKEVKFIGSCVYEPLASTISKIERNFRTQF